MRFFHALPFLIVVGLVLYAPTLANGFVWDDEELIVNNPVIHDFSRWRELFAGSTFNPGGAPQLQGLYYKPLMMMAFSLLYALFGANPAAFHGFQVLVHVANSILLFLILRRLSVAASQGDALRSWLPLSLSFLFLVHPINVEAVVYVADLQDVMSFFFGAAAVLVVVGARSLPMWQKDTSGTFAGVRTGALVGFFLLASLLSKETGIVFAGVSLLAVFLFRKNLLLPFLSASAAAAVLYGWLRFGVAGIFFQKHGLTPLSLMSLPERLVHIPAIIWFYLKTLLWPVDLTINQQWAIKEITAGNFWQPLGASLLLLCLISVVGVWLWRRPHKNLRIATGSNAVSPIRTYCFFFVWFAGGLGLHLQIFPLDLTVSDRWFYTPFAGLLGMIGVVGCVKLKPALAGIVGTGLLLVVLSARTMLRIRDWKDGITLYGRDIVRSSDAFDLHNNLGVELFRVGKIAEAKEHFVRSTELSPLWWTNWNNLGAVVEREGDEERALSYYRKAIDTGGYYLAYENYAGLLLKLGRISEAEQFLTTEALPRLPGNERLRQLLQGARAASKARLQKP